MAYGPHLIIDAEGISKHKANDVTYVRRFLTNLAKEMNMDIITGDDNPCAFQIKAEEAAQDKCGITGSIISDQSHVCIHTYPEKDFLFCDIFSGEEFDFQKATDMLKKAFKVKKLGIAKIVRGKNFPD